ncbi:hypothetical protein M404DRAFT_777209 [Pisolithus tinctorius Marx 270]|uniref:Uncharacterized protein n=1 Tax=Pisolithus tinctorius Marx 270 TaxID=870435 RepID=A0A0C3NXE6_PISTI|nr:hypothetical protein M404DRAFT_777209 [Pisolithus tinctorius Marx 270]
MLPATHSRHVWVLSVGCVEPRRVYGWDGIHERFYHISVAAAYSLVPRSTCMYNCIFTGLQNFT